jgi:hypothetical protein
MKKHASIRVALLTSAGALTALVGCSSEHVPPPMGAGGVAPSEPIASAGEPSMLPAQPGKPCGDACVSGAGAGTGEGTGVAGSTIRRCRALLALAR